MERLWDEGYGAAGRVGAVYDTDRPSAGRAESADPWLFLDIVRAVLTRRGGPDWTVSAGGKWWFGTQDGTALLPQGWKIHVSATVPSAPVVLSRVTDVLVGDGCTFKFARDPETLAWLLSNRCDRGSGGKFITAYPSDDEQFRRLAERLDEVTAGLPGPVVLSDRAVRPGSLVHYRFGAIAAAPVLSNDGTFVSMLTAPDGRPVRDERSAWYRPPSWVRPPWVEPEPNRPAATAGATGVVIGDRFVVRRAIRHSYRGGVFLATDRHTGADVVLKQARPHVLSSLDGSDARDLLRHEATVLERLGPLGVAPAVVALVDHQDNLFLAEELIPGTTLHSWTVARTLDAPDTPCGRGVPVAETIDLAGQLLALVDTVHEQDLVLRDLSPANVMVTPTGRLRLIDLEHAAATEDQAWTAYTKGYAAPEVLVAPRYGPVPSARADWYSAGVTTLFLASGVEPLPVIDPPTGRRLADLVAELGRDMPAVRQLTPLVLGLTDTAPERRWSLRQARASLAEPPAPGPGGPPVAATDFSEPLLIDGVEYLVRAMTPPTEQLWAGEESQPRHDVCNVQQGAAGVLGVLTRAGRLLGGDRLRDAVAAAASFVDERLRDGSPVLPGLYFGRSGTAWSLFDAATFLDDGRLAERAVDLAKQVPVRWPNPDVCHGAAGAGLAQLHLWRETGDAALKRRVIRAADGVLAAAVEQDEGLVWPIPAGFDSRLAGAVHYGFAHGVAGVGAFLLAAGLATDREDYLAAARRAGVMLSAAALVADGAARWPVGPGNGRRAARMQHWCNGASGIGTFLVRLWRITGDDRLRRLAEAAAVTVHGRRWYANTSACHGLAGDGEFLIDLAGFTGEERYRAWAHDLAATIGAHRVVRQGLAVVPGDRRVDVTPGYNTGLAGPVGFLLRLRHAGPRWWMLDDGPDR